MGSCPSWLAIVVTKFAVDPLEGLVACPGPTLSARVFPGLPGSVQLTFVVPLADENGQLLVLRSPHWRDVVLSHLTTTAARSSL